jgi:hypothetical protein
MHAKSAFTVTIEFRAPVNGQVMGSYDAPRKSVAKEAAAEQALNRLGQQ